MNFEEKNAKYVFSNTGWVVMTLELLLLVVTNVRFSQRQPSFLISRLSITR